jgi:hypothetical protein
MGKVVPLSSLRGDCCSTTTTQEEKHHHHQRKVVVVVVVRKKRGVPTKGVTTKRQSSAKAKPE